jgi:hypothetical protein
MRSEVKHCCPKKPRRSGFERTLYLLARLRLGAQRYGEVAPISAGGRSTRRESARTKQSPSVRSAGLLGRITPNRTLDEGTRLALNPRPNHQTSFVTAPIREGIPGRRIWRSHMQNIDNRKNSQQETASIGGDPLVGSGFENEQPDPEFAAQVGPETEARIR